MKKIVKIHATKTMIVCCLKYLLISEFVVNLSLFNVAIHVNTCQGVILINTNGPLCGYVLAHCFFPSVVKLLYLILVFIVITDKITEFNKVVC